jgi:hypothetical protein
MEKISLLWVVIGFAAITLGRAETIVALTSGNRLFFSTAPRPER